MEQMIYITTADMERLEKLIARRARSVPQDAEYLATLQERLERAEPLDPAETPPDVVTMESQVRVRDLDTGAESTYWLVFPNEADTLRNRISILAPIGTAMLGCRSGDTVEWRVPKGVRRLRILSVPFQPEADAAGKRPAVTRHG